MKEAKYKNLIKNDIKSMISLKNFGVDRSPKSSKIIKLRLRLRAPTPKIFSSGSGLRPF